MTEEALQIKVTDGTIQVNCPDYFDISLAESLHMQLSQLLDESGKTVIFDAEQVDATDTAILQLLYGFSRDASGKGLSVQWVNPSDAFCNAARLLGLEEKFGLECS